MKRHTTQLETAAGDVMPIEVGHETTHEEESPIEARNGATSPAHNETLVRRQGQIPTDEERAQIQAVFLETFAKCANVTDASSAAGVHRSTIYRWLADDEDFAAGWDEAEQAANDVLIREAWRRGVEGYTEPVVSLGKLVVLNDGTPLTVRKYSDTLLLTLMRARMSQFREKSQLEVNASITSAAANAHQLNIDVRGMTNDELTELRKLAERVKAREQTRMIDKQGLDPARE